MTLAVVCFFYDGQVVAEWTAAHKEETWHNAQRQAAAEVSMAIERLATDVGYHQVHVASFNPIIPEVCHVLSSCNSS